MESQVVVHRGRTVVISVGLGYDVSGDIITSQIREAVDVSSPLIAEWDVEFLGDGTDGELVLTLTDVATAAITRTNGYMDFKRVSGSGSINVIDDAIPVVIKGVVTQ